MNIFSCATTLGRAINFIDTKYFKKRYYWKIFPIWSKLALLIGMFILIGLFNSLSIVSCLLFFFVLVHFRFLHLVRHLLVRVLHRVIVFVPSQVHVLILLLTSSTLSPVSPSGPSQAALFRRFSFAPIRAESSHQVREIFLRRLLGRVQPIVSGVSSFVAFRAFAWDPWDQGPKTRLVIM